MLNPNPDSGIYSILESTPRVDVPVMNTVESLLLTAPNLPPPFIPIISHVQQAPAPLSATAPSTSQQDLLNFAVSSISGIVDKYLDHRMNEAVKVAVQLQSDKLQNEAQVENEDFLNKLDENIQKIIKEQVKEQVKTSYAVAADLSELELKKILIEKMESNKSIHRSNQQKYLYKALVDAYESEEPMHITQDLEEPAHQEFETSATDDQPIAEASQHLECNLAKKADSRTSFDEMMDTPDSFLAFVMNRLKVDTLTPELLAGHQYLHDLLKPLPLIPNSRGHRVIPFDHFINNDLEYLRGGASSQKYTTSVTKIKAADYGHIKWIKDLVPRTMWSQVLVDVPVTNIVESLLLTAPNLPPPSIPIISQVQQAPAPLPATAPSTSQQDLPNFGSLFRFNHRLKALEANLSEFMQTNQFAEAVSFILGIVDKYLDHRRNEAQVANEDFLNKLDENIQKIIKEQVKVQVSKILPKIKKTVNEQIEAEVLTRASNSSKTSYAVATDLSELKLKKILIEKMESNKSIHQSTQQKNLYKALVNAYECDKIILDTYEDTVTLKRRKEPESTNALKEKTFMTFGKSTKGTKSYQKTTSESAPAEKPMHITQDLEELAHQEFKTGATDDQPIAKASQHLEWFHKQTKPPTLDHA
nr:hypothetical protein [Tanacetum cinerariifolium]